jgi:hypothetical protein
MLVKAHEEDFRPQPTPDEDFDDASKEVDDVRCATAAGPDEPGRVFTQIRSADAGHSWRPELRRLGKFEAAGTGANTAATPPEHWPPSLGLIQPYIAI